MQLHSDHLRTLAAVLDEGSFDAAARALSVTPSAVSQRIKALEQQLGRVLLVRSKPIRATASGELVMRLARQFDQLEHETLATLGVESGAQSPVTVPLAVNADSLGTWILPALAQLSRTEHVRFDLYREDQAHTVALLEAGTVMAAVTSAAEPVPGCTVRPLGAMQYRPMASPGFAASWFPQGVSLAALAEAPVVNFDRRDDLQHGYLAARFRRRGQGADAAAVPRPPSHFVPSSADFATAVELGLGWGMLPPLQVQQRVASGALVDLDPSGGVDIPLYWQQWRLASGLLSRVADAVEAAARAALLPA
ncbi:LysR family transcriptional regulator ArgP [Microterricola pindariensis]|uniref:Transcriptional regulator ArgP n=1 Tax=Microterricola pindariensis TaxID=478010 RepID=A0ABX5B1V3_9MICO|nr:LysR family transcriptional regulator ArgP [Microterricola pindariensis]PPL20419.1 transcriptional regulator ArgP [Microterricola pindariensis]